MVQLAAEAAEAAGAASSSSSESDEDFKLPHRKGTAPDLGALAVLSAASAGQSQQQGATSPEAQREATVRRLDAELLWARQEPEGDSAVLEGALQHPVDRLNRSSLA